MQENSTIKQNILQYLDFKGITKYQFYKDTGITRGILSQNNGMSEDNTLRFLAYFNEVNPEWLLTGKGSMLKSETKPGPAESDDGIPLIPLDAMAGWGEGDVQVMDYDTKRYVIPEFEELHVDFMIYVKGNSMIPRYSAGDLVACKKLPLDTFFQWNKIYVLDTIQGAMIKRIHQSDIESSIKCVSENPDYPPFDLHSDEINSIALVVGVVSFE